MKTLVVGLIVGGILLFGSALFFVLKLKTRPEFGGGFTRTFAQGVVRDKIRFDLLYNSYYVAGLSDERIYFGNSVAPSYLLTLSKNLEDSIPIRLQFPSDRLARRALQVNVVGEEIIAFENITPAFVSGYLKDPRMTYHAVEEPNFLSVGSVLSRTSLIVKSNNLTKVKAVFKKTLLGHSATEGEADILEKQIDGILCTDGQLLYDPYSAQLMFVYFYRNRMMHLDTNLHVIRTLKTIDTVSTAHLKVGTISSEGIRTMAAPPVMVNKKGFLSKSWFIVHSALRGDGEDLSRFQSSSVFDVYDLTLGHYHCSFYIADLNGFKVKSFAFNDSILVVLQDHYVTRYRISLK